MIKLNIPTLLWFLVLHAGALAAPFYFTWDALFVAVGLAALTGLSVTLGFHRYLTHASFQTYPWVRFLLAFLGGLAGEGSALVWVATHRKHHAHSDQPGDPHSPRDGKLWAHILWMLPKYDDPGLCRQYAPDLLKEPGMRFLDRTFLLWHVLLAVGLYAVGGLPWLLWGTFLRTVFVLHTTWCVNSITHVFGYRNYRTNDDSTNCWWVALLTFGEGWHNNHHHLPWTANHGHRRWEIDPTYWVIRAMAAVGLAWNVKTRWPR